MIPAVVVSAASSVTDGEVSAVSAAGDGVSLSPHEAAERIISADSAAAQGFMILIVIEFSSLIFTVYGLIGIIIPYAWAKINKNPITICPLCVRYAGNKIKLKHRK